MVGALKDKVRWCLACGTQIRGNCFQSQYIFTATLDLTVGQSCSYLKSPDFVCLWVGNSLHLSVS